MLKHRIIPCLLLQNGALVKTLRFKNPKYVGDPINAIKIFNEKEVDELIVLDIEATNAEKDPDFSLIENIASECFMPLCYGGGVRTLEHAKKLFSLGIEKISLQSMILEDMSFLTRLSQLYGSQSIVASVDIKRNWLNHPKLYSSCRKETLNIEWIEFLHKIEKAGAGEIVINSVNADGTRQGMDIELIKLASKNVSIPVIAMGGAGSLQDIKLAIQAGASAVAAGAYFIFYGPHRAVLINYPDSKEAESILHNS